MDKDKEKEYLLEVLIDECALEVIYEAHRESKLANSICQVCLKKCRGFVNQPGVDIFGQNSSQTNGEKYECNNCHEKYPAVRFAQHLEKCLGFGRTATRARRRNKDTNSYADRNSSSPFGDSDTDKDNRGLAS
ncbi:hypothetical protein BJ742DRAFT_487402 [Cladochytrium replicatum]|nr:hypothetical protein BJ742DRAFT_487402 [Cladochytrium replicatum]